MDVHSRAKCSNLILRIAYQRFFSSSFIQTILAGFTAGRDLHPALKIVIQLTDFIIALRKNMSRESFIPTLLLLLL